MADKRRLQKLTRFSLGTLLLITTAVCGYFGGHRRGYEEGLRGGLDARLETREYRAYDLIAAPGLPFAQQPDFASLIDLIQGRVAPESWVANGPGAGKIDVFPANLSLFVTQTSAVHKEIAELLKELRRAQPPIASR